MLCLFTASTLPAQDATKEKRVAIRAAGGRYLSAAANGGFDLDSRVAGDKSTYTILGAKGGELADGDEVKIKYSPGYTSDAGKTKSSFWIEEAGKVKRVNVEPPNRAGTFKLKKQGAGFVLQTASGKFVAGLGDGALTLVDAPGSALVFAFEERPTVN